MKSLDFLRKLKKEGKLEIVEPSEEIALSYEKKSAECREVAKLTFDNHFFESAITQSYYAMYNALLSLFFTCGIKCENHTAAAILIKDFFNQKELYDIFSRAKEERIDKQYYTSTSQTNPATKESTITSIQMMTYFNPRIIALKNNLKNKEIEHIRAAIKEF
jgi:uncharacterized protein (UPF0332 family)